MLLAAAAVPGPALASPAGGDGTLWPALLAMLAIVLFLAVPMALLMRDRRRLQRRLDDCQSAQQRALAAAQASHEVTRSQVELAERNFRQLRSAVQALAVPLSGALGGAERLSMLSGAHPELRHEASALADALQELVEQTREALDSAELEHHDVHLAMQELDMAALLRGVCAHYSLRAGEKRQRLDCHAELATAVRADLGRIREALEQMIAFALRATPAGEQVDVTLEHQGGAMLVRVRDRAPAFKPAQIQQLFARSQRASGSSTTSQDSGLWTARRVAELHGGELQLAPRADGGNELVLSLPMAAGAVRLPGGAATSAT